MSDRPKTDYLSPWRKLAIIPGNQNGTFELHPGQDCGNESYRDFDVWIGLEGRAAVDMLGHELEFQKDRMILVPPGVPIRLRGKADQRLKMLYTPFNCLVSGRAVRNASACVSPANLTLALRGLPAIALVAEIDSETVSHRLTQARRSFPADLAEMTLSLLYLEMWRRLRETYLCPHDSSSVRRLEKAMNYFESMLEQKITLAETARHASVSPETLGRLFRVYYKTSPMHLLQRMRLTRARDLLLSGRFNISEAGYASGFRSPQYFSHVFKRIYGMTPLEFTKQPARIS